MLLSAVLNNTPVCAMLMPVARSWAASLSPAVAPKQLMMPLSFATMLGGTITLIGSSTNLVAAEERDEPGGAEMEPRWGRGAEMGRGEPRWTHPHLPLASPEGLEPQARPRLRPLAPRQNTEPEPPPHPLTRQAARKHDPTSPMGMLGITPVGLVNAAAGAASRCSRDAAEM